VSAPKRQLPAIRRDSLGAQVAETLRHLISTDQLKPGDRIIEAEWATRFGVSRGPIRDAIRTLATEGLLACPTGGSAHVAEPQCEELQILVGLRYRMEEYAVELAIRRITPEGIEELRGIIAEMYAAWAAGDERRQRELDLCYHRTLWGWTGSRRLEELLSLAISPLMLSRLWLSHNADIVAAHERTLEAIASGDVEAACRNLRQGLPVALEDIVRRSQARE
jgi:DNA-binding GntR family transcriptional regulator